MPTTLNGPVPDTREPFFMVPWSTYTAGYTRILLQSLDSIPGAPELVGGVAITAAFWRRAGLDDSWEVGYEGTAGGIEYGVTAIQWDDTADEQQWQCIGFRLSPLFYKIWIATANWTTYPRLPFELHGSDGVEYPLRITPLSEWVDIAAKFPAAVLSDYV